jgi:hypothetical protein
VVHEEIDGRTIVLDVPGENFGIGRLEHDSFEAEGRSRIARESPCASSRRFP